MKLKTLYESAEEYATLLARFLKEKGYTTQHVNKGQFMIRHPGSGQPSKVIIVIKDDGTTHIGQIGPMKGYIHAFTVNQHDPDSYDKILEYLEKQFFPV